MWPSWRLFEPAIRRMAGLGARRGERMRITTRRSAATADVLVVGAGLAGLTAAVAAAQAGARTLLLSASERVGGALACPRIRASRRCTRARSELGVRILTRTVAFGVYDHGLVCALRDGERRGQRRNVGGRAARAAVEDPRARRDRGHRSVRAPVALRGQRPSGRDARRRSGEVRARPSGSPAARAPCSLAHSDSAYAVARRARPRRHRDLRPDRGTRQVCRHGVARRAAAARPVSARCTAHAACVAAQ